MVIPASTQRILRGAARVLKLAPATLLTYALVGCTAPGPQKTDTPLLGASTISQGLPRSAPKKKTAAAPAKGPATSDNVVEIVQFYSSQPWILDDEGRYIGLRDRVYFVSADSGKGVFVPGEIVATLYTLNHRPDGTYTREKAHEWRFTPDQSYLFQVTTPSPMGYSYGLILRWPPELKLMGREIQIVLSYQRQNGQVLTAAGIKHDVPMPGSAPPGAIEVTTTTRPAGVPVPAAPPAGTPPPAVSTPPGGAANPPPTTQPARGIR